jgi:predicted PurR-regulated permease PerM
MGDSADDPLSPAQPVRDRAALLTIATYLVIAATAWYLLKELAPVLRPLALAVFLAYVIVPVQARVARRTSRIVALIVLGLVAVAGCGLLTALTYDSAVDLSADLPRFTQRGKAAVADVRGLAERWPSIAGLIGDPEAAVDRGAGKLNDLIATVAGTAANVLSEGMVVGVSPTCYSCSWRWLTFQAEFGPDSPPSGPTRSWQWSRRSTWRSPATCG